MPKILVIEDELEIRANLLEFLAMEEYEVIGADNGITGLLGALEHKPDLILCDVMMPELCGYDVLEALRQEPSTALIPFVFLTALADKGDIRSGMKLGADDYLTKPFTFTEVINTVETQLQKQATLSQHYQMEQGRVASLQAEIKQFKENLNQEQALLLSDIRSELKDSLLKLNAVDSLLKLLPPGVYREQSISLIRGICVDKIKLLSKIPNFEYLPETLFEDLLEV